MKIHRGDGMALVAMNWKKGKHYHFRLVQHEAKRKKRELALSKPPRKSSDVAWWDEDYSDPHKIRDRELFA